MTMTAELERIIAQRPGGQCGAQIVVDAPRRFARGMTRAWPRHFTDGPIVHRSVLHVLTDSARARLAEVADATQWKRSWGAHLFMQWAGLWREREQFITHFTQYPSATPGLFSGGAVPWEREPSPPIRNGDDMAAHLLHKHRFDHAAALDEIAPWADDMPDARDYWRVSLNLRLAPLSRGEAMGVWLDSLVQHYAEQEVAR